MTFLRVIGYYFAHGSLSFEGCFHFPDIIIYSEQLMNTSSIEKWFKFESNVFGAVSA